MANGFVVSKDTWEHLSQEQREWMMFDAVQNMHRRVSRLEKRPVTDKVFSLLGGFLGGAAAWLGVKIGG